MCVQQKKTENETSAGTTASTDWGRQMTLQITEHETFDVAEAVDAEAGLVKGVKLLGLRSANRNADGTVGRDYDTQGVQESAARLFPGTRVYIDHPVDPAAPRRYEDAFGVVENYRYVAGKGHFGDLRYNTRHRLASQFAEDVQRFPRGLGFSINAVVRPGKKPGKGGMVIESLEVLRSVDVVTRPATAVGVFEHDNGSSGQKNEGVSQVSVEQLQESLEELKKQSQKQAELMEAMAAENARLKAEAEGIKVRAQVSESLGKVLTGPRFETEVGKKFLQDAIECACEANPDLRKKIEKMLADAGPLFEDDGEDITAGADEESAKAGERDAQESERAAKVPAIGKRGAAAAYGGLRKSLGLSDKK